MIRNSFIFLPGVGKLTEEKIWGSGIRDWDRFLESSIAGPIKGRRKEVCDEILLESRNRLDKRDLSYFSSLIASSETWRLWEEFGDGAVFLDIETMGTRRFHPITVVGAWDRKRYTALVRGKDLDSSSIRKLFRDASMIVTFNGRTFDVPMIESKFPGTVPDIPHLDLRFLGSRCGFRGGLKSLETSLGLSRPEDVKGMSGEDAVRLWHLYEKDHNRNALKLLLKYNREDIINLEPITETLVGRMMKKVIQ